MLICTEKLISLSHWPSCTHQAKVALGDFQVKLLAIDAHLMITPNSRRRVCSIQQLAGEQQPNITTKKVRA
jgi:hypothetical protein